MPLKTSQEKILGNSTNKAKFIDMLREKLQTAGILTFQCDEDAFERSQKQKLSKRVVIVAEDTDILVLLTALTPDNLDIYEKTPSGKKLEEIYSSKSLVHKNPNLKENILLSHAFSGCDITPAILGQGKLKFCQILEKFADLSEHAKYFKKKSQSAEPC